MHLLKRFRIMGVLILEGRISPKFSLPPSGERSASFRFQTEITKITKLGAHSKGDCR